MQVNDYIFTNGHGATLETEKTDENLEKWLKEGDFFSFFELLRCFEQSKPEFLGDVYRFCLNTLNDKKIKLKETSPFHFERLRLKYLTEILEGNTEDTVKAVRWLRVCVNTEDEYIRFYFAVSKRDKEKEVKDVIFEEGNRLKSFYLDKAELYAVALSDWFLKRYDIKSAQNITDELLQEEHKSNFLESISNYILSVYK